MKLQWSGLILALITFATIGLGHIMVRAFHAWWGTRPAIPFFLLSMLVMTAAFVTPDNLFSAALGVTAMTLFWDGVEIYRQEKRVHAGEKAKPSTCIACLD